MIGDHEREVAPLRLEAAGDAAEPEALRDLHVHPPRRSRPSVSGHPIAAFQRLHRLPGGALHEVVDGGDRERDAGARVERHADVGAVRVRDVPHLHAVRRQRAHERLSRVRRLERTGELLRGRRAQEPQHRGREDAAPDWREHRREGQRAAAAAVAGHGLLDLRHVLVTAEPVRAQVVRDLDEAVLLGRLAPRARDAAHPGHGDPVRRGEARLHERRHGERDGGRIAARVRDEPRARELRARELGQAVARLGEERGRGVREPVPARIRGRILEPERAGEVDHADPALEQSRRELRGHLGGRREERPGGLEATRLGEREVREGRGGAGERQPVAGARVRPAVRVDRREGGARVAREEAGELEARVAGGADDRDRMPIHGSA